MSKTEKTLLVIDDEEPFRDFLQGVLEDRGYRVITADSVEQGLRAMACSAVDLVITDMMMPDMRGSELVALLRNKGSKIKILAMTGHPAGDAALAASEAFRVDGVMYKPFSAKEIVAVVQGLLLRKRGGVRPAGNVPA
jgi:two-component system response regulator RegX3